MSEWEKEYTEKGVAILAVNAFESPDTVRAWIEKSDLHFNWTFTDAASLDRLGITAVPVQILIGRDGKVRWTSSISTMSSGATAVRDALDEALAAAAPKTAP
jgi:hypothetical protein